MSEENSWWDRFVDFLRDWVDVSSAYDPDVYPDPARGAEELEKVGERMRGREENEREQRDREAEDEYREQFGD